MAITIATLKELNKKRGNYWFSPDTMRFFDSRIESEISSNGYFVSSEKACFNDNRRVFKIRQAQSFINASGVREYTGEITTPVQPEITSKAVAMEFREKLNDCHQDTEEYLNRITSDSLAKDL